MPKSNIREVAENFRKALLSKWRHCHYFALFFADFPIWLDRASGPENQAPETRKKLFIAYDALFKGTCADIHLPLWASACSGEGLLLDSITLDLIQTYHAWGYDPVAMDGNPPDFIGQQFRFLCYLHASAHLALD
jgi:anaerobic dimethyl sulfoxide reductase subunit A